MNYRFSGHETFPLRFSWLTKAVRGLGDDPMLFSDEDEAMVRLGVGKNMMRAIRFWVVAAGMAEPRKGGGYVATRLGSAILSTKGHDPYLEDVRTLWLVHWNLSSHVEEPIFAWDYLLNRWPHPEITPSGVLKVFHAEAQRLQRNLSTVTLQQHFDVFLHTYVPTRGRKGPVQEDTLDSPLVELDLIRLVGERDSGGGRWENVFAFDRDAKPDISGRLFAYCLDNYWRRRFENEQTLTFRHVSVLHGSPGQIFKLSEPDIRERLESLAMDSNGVFEYEESASLQRVIRTDASLAAADDLLAGIYQMDVHA